MKYLIVNVDDLGGSRGINRGILETLLSRGAVTGCSPGRKPGEVYALDCCRSCGWKRNSPPWQRRGGRAIKKYSRSFERRGRGGSFKLQDNSLERTTPSAPVKVASRHFLKGAATPPLPRRGVSFQPQLRQQSNAIQGCEVALCQPLSLLPTT